MLEQAQINNNQITQQEIQEYFEDLNLSEEQMNHIYSYLVAHRITVKGYVPSASMRRESRQYEDSEPEQDKTGEQTEYGEETESAFAPEKKEKASESVSDEDKVEPDSVFLRMYLRELRGKEKLTKAEETELLTHLLGTTVPEEKAELKERFVHHKLRHVVSRARKYALGGETLDELVQEGNIGLLTAMEHLADYHAAEEFLAHVESEILHAMEQFINETYASDSEEKAMVAKVTFVSEAAKSLKEENGEEPTLAELAAYTNLTEEELLSIINLSADNLKV